MTHLTKLLSLLILALVCLTTFAREHEGAHSNSLLLNGSWEFVLGDGNEHAEDVGEGDKLLWKPVTLPGVFMTYKT